VATDLRPPAILSVGMTGHRDLASVPETQQAIEDSIAGILASLTSALRGASEIDKAFFSPDESKLLFLTMAADGADLLGARAAARCGVDHACILPFPMAEYSKDFEARQLPAASEFIASASSMLELPGCRKEDARAYERANEVILSNIDVLIAVWDGQRARGRAGTEEVVQGAVVRNIPVIIIDPDAPGSITMLEVPDDQNLAPRRALDLGRTPLPSSLDREVRALICPPPDRASRRALNDLYAEKPRGFGWRYEYHLLLRLLAGDSAPESEKVRPVDTAISEADGLAADAGRFKSGSFESCAHDRRVLIDKLARDYGELFRSSSVSRYLLAFLGTLASSLVWLLLPWLTGAAIVISALINGVILLDSTVRGRWRWQERWLEYRNVAQRLHWSGLLPSPGLETRPPATNRGRNNFSWIDWYANRSARALGPPSGSIDSAYLTACAEHLQDHIKQQVAYHRSTFRKLGLLEKRLALIGRLTSVTSILVAILLGTAVVRAEGLQAVGWKAVAMVFLTVLPAATAAMNGLRAEMDLVRLIERSGQTIALLSRVNRAISDVPLTYDRVSAAAARMASIMDDELKEWRFVLESRRSRARRHRKSIFGWLRRRLS
jgi:hypothetical protein